MRSVSTLVAGNIAPTKNPMTVAPIAALIG